MNYKNALIRFFSAGAFVLLSIMFANTSLAAQSYVIFCGKIINQQNEFAGRAQFNLDFYTQSDSNSRYQLDSFGCGYYQELGIFWLTAEHLDLQDTLKLEIENRETAIKQMTTIIINCDTSRIINLGEFSLAGDSSENIIFIGDSIGPGENDLWTTDVAGSGYSAAFSHEKSLHLAGPYPNPFIPLQHTSLKIPIFIHTKSVVWLSVYDIRGALVWQKEVGQLSPGAFVAQWHGRNLFNQLVASGTYVVVVGSDSQRETKLITLVN